MFPVLFKWVVQPLFEKEFLYAQKKVAKQYQEESEHVNMGFVMFSWFIGIQAMSLFHACSVCRFLTFEGSSATYNLYYVSVEPFLLLICLV